MGTLGVPCCFAVFARKQASVVMPCPFGFHAESLEVDEVDQKTQDNQKAKTKDKAALGCPFGVSSC